MQTIVNPLLLQALLRQARLNQLQNLHQSLLQLVQHPKRVSRQQQKLKLKQLFRKSSQEP